MLIREVGPAGWLRVSAGTPEEMAAFKLALADGAGGEAMKSARGTTPLNPRRDRHGTREVAL